MRYGTWPVFIVMIVTGVLYAPAVLAQSDGALQQAFSVAVTRPVVPEAVDGDIVVFDPANNIYRLAAIGDGVSGLAVLAIDSALVLRTSEEDMPIISTGLASVNVIATNGPIPLGAAIGPSGVAGKGERADAENGYVIGFARESFVPETDNIEETGKILVEVSPGSWQDAFGTAEDAGRDVFLGTARPLFGFLPRSGAALARFVLAVLLAILVLVLAYRLYARSLITGLESIGRNPLAQRSIKTMMILNISVIVILALVGLAVSALIVAL